MKIFRLQNLTVNSATFADPLNLQHVLNQTVRTNPKKIGQTDNYLNRVEMKEVMPLTIVDGTSSTLVNQVVGVTFSGYTSSTSQTALKATWERMKQNVDKAILDGVLLGFRSEKVDFIADLSA